MLCTVSKLEAIQNGSKSNSGPGLNRGLSNFWWLRSANYVKFTEDCVMCTKKHISVKKKKKKKVYKWAQNSIQDEDRPSRPTMTSTLEMVDSVNALILVNRRVIKDDISEQLGISMGMMTLPFLKSVVIGFHQDNAKPHTIASVSLIGHICHIPLTVQICTPPFLFVPCRNFLKEPKFSRDDEENSTMSKWLKSQLKDIYVERIQMLAFDKQNVL